MKTLIFSIAFALSSTALASAICPSQTQKVAICLSTPMAGDQEVAANVFDSIAICEQGSDSILVPEKDGESESTVAEVTRRIGGTTYLIQTADMDFSLLVVTGINSQKSPAQLRLDLKGNSIVASSTYTCTR